MKDSTRLGAAEPTPLRKSPESKFSVPARVPLVYPKWLDEEARQNHQTGDHDPQNGNERHQVSLPGDTWLRLLVWLIIGMAVYFGYGRHHSRVQAAAKAASNRAMAD